MISLDKNGGRTIHLFLPFEYNGKKIESIVIGPMRFGHVLRWNEGDWKTAVALLTELAGVDEAVIRELRYPDADRVMDTFLQMLPPEIRNDISEGRIPVKPPLPESEEVETPPQAASNGSGQAQDVPLEMIPGMIGPGAPLPPVDTQPGFDLSDEHEQP
jgi:hypothetical protein